MGNVTILLMSFFSMLMINICVTKVSIDNFMVLCELHVLASFLYFVHGPVNNSCCVPFCLPS